VVEQPIVKLTYINMGYTYITRIVHYVQFIDEVVIFNTIISINFPWLTRRCVHEIIHIFCLFVYIRFKQVQWSWKRSFNILRTDPVKPRVRFSTISYFFLFL
jgi:hypothetical protein